MFNTVLETSKGMSVICENHSKMNEPIEFKELFYRYTTDSIVSCAFGLECNTLQDETSVYRHFGKKLFVTQKYRQIMGYLLPDYVFKKFNIKLTEPDIEKFLFNLIKDTITYRENNNYLRKDFMQLLIQVKNRGNVDSDDKILNDDNTTGNFLTLEQITAQCYLFFAAGFETSAIVLTETMYELAMHQDIQNKLRKHIEQVLFEYGGNLSYESIMRMEYLDAVINGK